MNDKKIQKFLIDLGLDKFEAAIYLTLAKKGILTTLELSRQTGIDRSKVYRRLEHLKDVGVVEEVIDEKKKRAKAVEVDRLEYLLCEKEESVKNLRGTFKDVKLILSGKVGLNEPGTKVLFYRGREGIKQMVWNVLRAKKEVVGFTCYKSLSEFIGEKFMKKWIEEFVRRDLYFRDIVHTDYFDREERKASVEGYKHYEKHFVSRGVSPRVITVDHQVDIYNDVVSYYNWREEEVFGVEIYNKKVARMQKQIFEVLWGTAENKC